MATTSLEGFLINGIAPGDFSGYSVSSAGDINGDGLDDLVIGAIGADPNGSASGQSYLVFGSSQGFSPILNLSSLDGKNGFKISGLAAGDQLGYSVSSAGDINGDGIDDLVIGANRANPNGNDSGQSYIIFGSRNAFAANFSLSTLNGANGFKINGIAEGDRSGTSVSKAGDINGDGIADLIIGARSADPNGEATGQSYVVFGKRAGFSGDLELSTLDGSNGFILNGVAAGDNSGVSVSDAGDINGDGIDDLVIGASRANANGISSGQSYVVFGSRNSFSNIIDLSTLDGVNGFTIDGIAPNDRFGYAVSAAGDINGDGIGDVIIGSYYADPNGVNNAGQSYVIFGNTNGFGSKFDLTTLNGNNGFKINGIAAGDVSGSALSSAGDVNGDGIDDLLIGATYASPDGRARAGQNYVVFGRRNGFSESLELADLNGKNGFKINGITPEDISGVAVSTAGDVNGDGISDLIIGGAFSSPNSNNLAGQSAVVFGRVGIGASGVLELSQLLPKQTNGGTSGNDNLLGTAGNDQFLGSGGNDTINGGSGIDSISYSALNGPVTLKATGIVTKSTGGTDQLIAIETITASAGAGDTIDAFTPASTASIVANLATESFVVNGATPIPLVFTVKNFENIKGTTNNDSITGNLASNLLDGDAGNDKFFASGGNDTIIGGLGNDTVSYATLGGSITLKSTGIVEKSTGGTDQLVTIETIVAGLGTGDTIDAFTPAGSASVVANLATGSLVVTGALPNPLSFKVSNFENVSGTINNDTIIGNAVNNVLNGNDGNDQFQGSGGNDVIDGGTGSDGISYNSLGGSIILKATGLVEKSTGGTDQLISVESITASANAGDKIDAFTLASTASLVANLTTGAVVVTGATPAPLSFTVSNFEDVTGTANNDTITGNLANNVLDGGAGNDKFFGSGGDDIINGNVGNDSVSYASIGGPITLKSTGIVEKSTGGTDQLIAVETITASGGGGDKLDAFVPAGTAAISANLTTGAVVVTGAVSAPLNFKLINFEDITGTVNNDTLTGNTANNVLDGAAGDDKFFASGGDDIIDGNVGNDSISYVGIGGPITLKATGTVTKSTGGTDQLIAIETILAGAGAGDKIDAFSPASTAVINVNLTTGSLLVTGAAPSPLSFKVSNFEDVTGTANNDTITGNLANNVLDGGAGNDKFFGSGGDDIINGNVGNDSVSYASIGGPITLKATGIVEKSTGGTDQLIAIEAITASTGAGDKIDAFVPAGTASIIANLATGSLVVNGAASNPLTFVVSSFENVTGTVKDDTIIGDAGNNDLDGNAGNDNLDGGAGNDTVHGGAGTDNINGSAGNDSLDGGAGNDTLDGGVGNDTIDGGAGADQLRGGAGADVFVFQFGQSPASSIDRILDFAIGTDKIDLFSAAGIAASAPLGFSRATNNGSAANLSALATAVYADADGALSGNQALGASNAALVTSTNAAIAGTYLFIDNGTAGFQIGSDLVVNVTGFSGSLPALGSIVVNTVFV